MTHQSERSSEGAPDEMAAQDRWCTQRAEMDDLIAEATELRRKVCPDEITDTEGRVWTWWKGDLYRCPMPHLGPDYTAAWPKSFITPKEQ